jgi:hypothetical protein
MVLFLALAVFWPAVARTATLAAPAQAPMPSAAAIESLLHARITISYGEDIDRVVAILRSVSGELMADETLPPVILDPFDYQGVDALGDSSVVLLVRIRTLPGQQWKVGRAFNRLVKLAFEKHGIAWRNPSAVVITGALPAVEGSRNHRRIIAGARG